MIFRNFLSLIKQFVKKRSLILDLAYNDFRSKYLGSYFGALWAFIQPTAMVLIFWFIFEMGFKSQPVNDIPYIIYFIASIIPWFFFSESLSSATNSVTENSHLVKRIVFNVEVLPMVKIISSLIVHCFFIVFVIVILFLYGIPFSIVNLQLLYFLLATILLVQALSWITATLNVFIKDTAQAVSMLLQFGFWLTPIFWSLNMMPEKFHLYIKLLPMYYIVEGYRSSLLYHTWFWESEPYLTVYFWSFTGILLLVGGYFFKKTSVHFADVI
ncbi:ABC transporter permease [Paenibacillus sp.]|uniref:ABC transporter permease n=1 Tax=Paenibacillus sp. TaxID=58172 RepID=UPI0028117F93|nr:ABC transporter permease [Paenibacillus sp.]